MNFVDMDFVVKICSTHDIPVSRVSEVPGGEDKRITVVNGNLLVRLSDSDMFGESFRFERISHLSSVPRILHHGTIDGEKGSVHYLVMTMIPGTDLMHACGVTTPEDQYRIGWQTAAFLDELHAITGKGYDIGFYIPAIPEFTGSWVTGHEQYQNMLRKGSSALALEENQVKVMEKAFAAMESMRESLVYQSGPVLLHNDFHPKNIVAEGGHFSGVIDWECSQYGERDFEVSHFIHWCLYPTDARVDLRPFLKGFFQASPWCSNIPDLASRLSVYQLEHEIQQIIWSGGTGAVLRIPRIEVWLDGAVGKLLDNL